MASQDIRYSDWYVCKSDLSHSLLTTRQRDGQSPTGMAVGSVEKDVGGQRKKPSWCVTRECGLKPLRYIWFCVAMRLYISLTKSNSYTMKKVLHADMQQSTRSNDCWSTRILSAMDGLTQSFIIKQKLQICEPIDLSRFVVDLRERPLEYWTPYSDTHPREHNSKRSTYHQWCALPTKRALATHSPDILSIHVSQPAS